MIRAKYYICDVFTDAPFGGNQLAIFPDAVNIPDNVLQSIAREFNFSETIFIYPPVDPAHTRRVRIFTPNDEMPFAGHPTIGAALILGAIGEIPLANGETGIVFEEPAGPVPVIIRSDRGKPVFAQLTAPHHPRFDDATPDAGDLALMLHLSKEELDTNHFPIKYVSVGYPFLFVAVKSSASLGRIRINSHQMESMKLNEVFVFTNDVNQSDVHFRARMFAPLLGIPEDPATGSACAAFAGYLAALNDKTEGTYRWTIEQGIEMGRPSKLFIEADKINGAVSDVRVGGNAVIISEGLFTV